MTRSPLKASLRLLLPLIAAVVVGSALTPQSASAARGLVTGMGDPIFYTGDTAEREHWLDQTKALGAGVARINIRWYSVVGTSPPADPRDPADSSYDFAKIDRAVLAAHARGLRVVLTLFGAPTWAEGPSRPVGPIWGDMKVPTGAWRPDPGEFGKFSVAVARRYSGTFAGLPRVRFFESWNEPNLLTFLNPQVSNGSIASARIYRQLLNAMYDGIHSVHSDNVVIAGATAPFGSPVGNPIGQLRVRPVAFLRDLFCLEIKTKRVRIKKKRKRGPRFKRVRSLVRKSCPERPKFDALSHHPISIDKGPGHKTRHPDDASTNDLGRIRQVLRKAEALGTVLPRQKKRRHLWVTEFWWKTNPPDDMHGVSMRAQADRVQDSMFRFWQGGAHTVIYYFIVDREITSPITENDARGTGLYFVDGRAKPATRAFRFPFVVRRISKQQIRLWTKVPSGGLLRMQRFHRGKWRKLAVRRTKAGAVVHLTARVRKGRKKQRLRALVGRDVSLVASLK